jgi:hypothetical protein
MLGRGNFAWAKGDYVRSDDLMRAVIDALDQDIRPDRFDNSAARLRKAHVAGAPVSIPILQRPFQHHELAVVSNRNTARSFSARSRLTTSAVSGRGRRCPEDIGEIDSLHQIRAVGRRRCKTGEGSVSCARLIGDFLEASHPLIGQPESRLKVRTVKANQRRVSRWRLILVEASTWSSRNISSAFRADKASNSRVSRSLVHRQAALSGHGRRPSANLGFA